MTIANKVWWTRKSRIEMERRLLSTAFQSQLILLWYSFFSVATAIYYLRFSPNSAYAPVAWLILSILVLTISGFITSLRLRERASLTKECYEALQRLHEKLTSGIIDEKESNDEYIQILSVSDNHKERDYFSALCNAVLAKAETDSSLGEMDRLPNKYIWATYFFHKIRAGVFLLLVYVLPISVFYIVEFCDVCSG